MTTGLTWLYHQVADRFTAEAINIEVAFGWAAVDRKIDGAVADYRRAVWTPGDDNRAGVYDSARYPGRTPRSLGTIYELFTITCSAYDHSQPDSEEAQYEAVREVEREVLRCIALTTPSNYEILDRRWLTNQKLLPKGRALQIIGTIQSTVPDDDTTSGVETFAERANAEVTFLDVTEEVVVTFAPFLSTSNITLAGVQGYQEARSILVSGQSDAKANGLYEVQTGVWVRSPIALVSGLLVEVPGGAKYVLTSPDPVVIGSSDITFVLVE